MDITGITLTDPARSLEYVLLPNDDVVNASLEFTPTVREVTEDLAARDGTLDTTQWLGAGAVTLTLMAVDGIAAVLDQIGGLCVPWARPYLVVSSNEWTSDRQVQVRFDSVTHPIESSTYRAVQLAWKAPAGVWEDTATQQWTIAAGLPDLTGVNLTVADGMAVTAADGVTMPASTQQAASVVTVNGNLRPAWRARLYGPCMGPKLDRADTGQTLTFTDSLVIAQGDYLELDSAARTVRYRSDPADSRLDQLDFGGGADWWPLDPGPNRVQYHASSGTTAASVCELTVFPVWMP